MYCSFCTTPTDCTWNLQKVGVMPLDLKTENNETDQLR